jgi:hypothetical protein
MASLLYWQDEDTGETTAFEFDSLVAETHEDTLTITDHPVEEGVDVADHAREEPTRLTIEGFVSNVPRSSDPDAAFGSVPLDVTSMVGQGTQNVTLNVAEPPIGKSLSGVIQAGIGALKGALNGAPKGTFQKPSRRATLSGSVVMLQQSSPRDRVRDAYEKLLLPQGKKLFVTAQTRLREHFDMLVERVSAPVTTEDGLGCTFAVDLRRVRIATSETVQSPKPAEVSGQVAKNGGSRNTKTSKNAAQAESIAHGLTGDLSGA